MSCIVLQFENLAGYLAKPFLLSWKVLCQVGKKYSFAVWQTWFEKLAVLADSALLLALSCEACTGETLAGKGCSFATCQACSLADLPGSGPCKLAILQPW